MYLTSLSGHVRATVLSRSNDVLSFTAHNSRHYKGDLLAGYQVGYPIKINHSISLKGTTLEIFLTFTRHVFRSPQSRKKNFLRKSMNYFYLPLLLITFWQSEFHLIVMPSSSFVISSFWLESRSWNILFTRLVRSSAGLIWFTMSVSKFCKDWD